ncbi:MAG: RNase adapter RapZ [Deltaproteobacteria bacterium CG11_big_fil_rev_8_21_14_0_20_45_16]|nr:MAG: RNase adapter RapZ [Deltaproteobacteria bacterium CG11_big_fil_rev_8_21_14_0_20_45_16]
MISRLVIITGLSGSGKSSALNAMEDMDYYAVDNLPVKLFEKFLELIAAGGGEIKDVAVVMDLRDQEFLSHYAEVFRKILHRYENVEILFLESSNEALTRRFSETRRKHPLSNTNVLEGIEKERELLSELKEMATSLVDTTDLNVHALKEKLSQRYEKSDTVKLQVRIVSFGFKFGTPKNCDLLLDVRFLSNPHFVPELKPYSGLDKNVQEYIDKDARSAEFITRTRDYLNFLIPNFIQEGKRYLGIGIGCTGGKHRSVYIAQKLGQELSKVYSCTVDHQDLKFNS